MRGMVAQGDGSTATRMLALPRSQLKWPNAKPHGVAGMQGSKLSQYQLNKMAVFALCNRGRHVAHDGLLCGRVKTRTHHPGYECRRECLAPSLACGREGVRVCASVGFTIFCMPMNGRAPHPNPAPQRCEGGPCRLCTAKSRPWPGGCSAAESGSGCSARFGRKKTARRRFFYEARKSEDFADGVSVGAVINVSSDRACSWSNVGST